MVQTSLDAKFSIDILVTEVFERHPLVNCIHWDYWCNGDFGPEVITQAFYGPDKDMERIMAYRLKTPEEQVVRFWELYTKYMLPHGNTIYAWHNDLLEEILKIRIGRNS